MGEHLTVVRIEDECGSYIEPQLDQGWSELDKLRWHLAVTELDHDIRWSVIELSPGMFALSMTSPGRSLGVGARPFNEAWAFISALGLGAETYVRQHPVELDVDHVDEVDPEEGDTCAHDWMLRPESDTYECLMCGEER